MFTQTFTFAAITVFASSLSYAPPDYYRRPYYPTVENKHLYDTREFDYDAFSKDFGIYDSSDVAYDQAEEQDSSSYDDFATSFRDKDVSRDTYSESNSVEYGNSDESTDNYYNYGSDYNNFGKEGSNYGYKSPYGYGGYGPSGYASYPGYRRYGPSSGYASYPKYGGHGPSSGYASYPKYGGHGPSSGYASYPKYGGYGPSYGYGKNNGYYGRSFDNVGKAGNKWQKSKDYFKKDENVDKSSFDYSDTKYDSTGRSYEDESAQNGKNYNKNNDYKNIGDVDYKSIADIDVTAYDALRHN